MKNNGHFLETYLAIIKEDTDNKSKDTLNMLFLEYNNKEEITIDDLINLLNIAVCDELLASFNYMISYTLSKTNGKADFDPEFEAHEQEELTHAHKLIKRLREMDAECLTINWADYVSKNSAGANWKQETSSNSIEILKNRYNEEVNAIKFYSLVLDCIEKMKQHGEWDTTTEHLIKEIKSDEEQHRLDLHDLIIQYNKKDEK